MEHRKLSVGSHTAGFWVVLGVVVLILLLVALSVPSQRLVTEASAWAQEIMNEHPVTGPVVFFLFSALSAMLAFASSTVLVPPASLAWGESLTFLLLWGGWLLGAGIAFGIGKLARPLLGRAGYEDKLEKYQQYVSHRMKFWAVLLFCIAIPSEIPGYLFGSMRYSFSKFMAAMAIAEAGYALGIVVAGEKLLGTKPLPFFVTIAVLALVALLASLFLRSARKGKSGGLSS